MRREDSRDDVWLSPRHRRRRTFSTFGDVRRMPSEYEIVTHAQNWTLRQNRAAAFEQNPSPAVITMTPTSAACPLTGILEGQIRAVLAPLSCVDGFLVDWQWIPAWRPADITASGRDQLRAVGFTI